MRKGSEGREEKPQSHSSKQEKRQSHSNRDQKKSIQRKEEPNFERRREGRGVNREKGWQRERYPGKNGSRRKGLACAKTGRG